jgi:DnaJ-like protein
MNTDAKRTRDPFTVLGVPVDADTKSIRSAYRALAKQHHPDRAMSGAFESHRRMSELNWAWEELRRDRAGWKQRVRTYRAVVRNVDETKPPQNEPEREAWWKEFCEKYRRPKGEPLGWRRWVGSDVTCRDCGCVLNTLVHSCPDCGATDAWVRSKLHSAGHHLRFVMWAIYVPTFVFAAAFLLGILAVPMILLLDIVGIGDEGPIWEWSIFAQVLLWAGVAAEALAIWRWNQLKTLAAKWTDRVGS